ncbi:hypothetical protein KSS87_002769 [Heliosperma pusillum]|nr:hypothetical protein KSS87_002769 [Heliosperma pusillum]
MPSFPNLRKETEMQGEESLKTLECLRGRLVAERAASRAAKDNADLMDAKLKDLEKQLKNELKFRKKAERKLSKLKKKLESLNIPFSVVSEGSEQASSSDHSGESCISSVDSNTALNQQEECLTKSDISNSGSTTGEITADCEINLVYETKDGSNCGDTCVDPSTFEEQLSDTNQDGLKTLALEEKNNDDVDEEEEDDIGDVDNSMALVLVDSFQETKNSSGRRVVEISDETVRDVLNNLKQIKDNLQCSLYRRSMIRV